MSGASGTSASPHGFVFVRGRGYRPEQADAYASAVSRDRDDAWERAARLTVLAHEMEAEAERLRTVVAELAPPSYDNLGTRAQYLLALSEEEAASVRADADAEAQRLVDRAEAEALQERESARAYADEVRAEAEERSRQRIAAGQAAADEIRVAARREVKELRGAALAALREVRERTAALLAEQEKDHAERWETAGRELAGREAAARAREEELAAAAEARLAEAKRDFAEAEETARHRQEDAEAAAAEVIAGARSREERIVRETERVLREHGEAWDEVRAHMDHVRSSLAALTGRAAAE